LSAGESSGVSASENAVRIASRHPERGKKLFGSDDPQLQSVQVDIHDEQSIADVLAGAYGVVNAVSLESTVSPFLR
jgi:saccharopine dehydrogenase-like NADP-dependent oxidoreductase